MSDNRQMSIAMQRLVDFISMVKDSTLLHNNTGANSTLLRNNTRAVKTMERNCDFCWVRPNITTRGSNKRATNLVKHLISKLQSGTVCLYACLFILYSFHKCFVRFVAYPNHMHIQIIVKTR
jgi:hypothetical protein